MRLRSLAWKEFLHRPLPMITGLVAVILGVAALVSVQTIARSSEARVAAQLERLGANVLVLPRSASLQDYYAADAHGATLPEEYVTRLALSREIGVEGIAPRLSLATQLDGQRVVLTGILPRADFQAKAAWQGVDLLSDGLAPIGTKHAGCKGHCHFATVDQRDPKSFAVTRVVQELPRDAALIGAEIARRHRLAEGSQVTLMGHGLKVAAVLPATGTVDDARVFAHLHTVQQIAGTGPVINVIEIISCCEDAAAGLVGALEALLPETNVVTISHIVDAQVAVNRLVGRLSYAFFGILILVGGTSIASVMYANVSERQRELGTLTALGASPAVLARLVLLKAGLLGLIGGLGGIVAGLLVAFVVGPQWLEIPLLVRGGPLALGALAALVVSFAASYLPARRAARLDPCACFREG
jgi:putative ABC transport system permease protein